MEIRIDKNQLLRGLYLAHGIADRKSTMPILATPKKKALYYWNVEKRAGGKIRCTGACARAWPPLIVRNRASVPRKIAGISGTFGTIRRPDGRWQVRHNGLPVYTYAHEGPEQVLCDNVDGWFVVRLR